MKRIINFIFAASILFINVKHADAQYFVGPVSLASGGSGTAAVMGSESSFINPAMIAHGEGYHIATFGSWTEDVGPARSRDLAVSLTENSFNSIVATSYGFVRRNIYADDDVVESQDYHQISFSKPVSMYMTLGFQVSYLATTPTAGTEKKNWNGSIGLLYLLTEHLGLGIVKYNLGGGTREVLPSKWDVGLNYLFGNQFRARADLSLTEGLGTAFTSGGGESIGFHTGMETLIGDQLWARAGFSSESRGWREQIHLGFGWAGPKLALDYAYTKNFHSAEQWTHGFDLRIYF
ncbi:MAG: hypothetical protein K2X47_13850 [Bdellovibrionales bacterium]|nr:hypothetical protein [Bdellovibrionales bacterium]